jgi:hypothetical protein
MRLIGWKYSQLEAAAIEPVCIASRVKASVHTSLHLKFLASRMRHGRARHPVVLMDTACAYDVFRGKGCADADVMQGRITLKTIKKVPSVRTIWLPAITLLYAV